MYHLYDGGWHICACIEDDFDRIVAVKTAFESDEAEDVDALSQLLYDEFGDANALYEAGEMFKIVAVPDDVAGFDTSIIEAAEIDAALACSAREQESRDGDFECNCPDFFKGLRRL